MTREQADEIVVYIKAATASRVDPATENFFAAALTGLDYSPALAAAQSGSNLTWRRFPSWAEFKEVYRSQKKLAEPLGEQRLDQTEHEEPEAKRGVAAPEWVSVWRWSRMDRIPTIQKIFPQQGGGDPELIMTMEEYKKVRDEWEKAGSPKYTKPLPMAR